jgi:hypothetical protein
MNAAYAERIIESVSLGGTVRIHGHRWLFVASSLRTASSIWSDSACRRAPTTSEWTPHNFSWLRSAHPL